MNWLLIAGVWWIGGAAIAWVARRRPTVVDAVTAIATLIGAVCLVVAALGAMRGMVAIAQIPWSLPFGALLLRLDPLSGVFLLPIAIVGAWGAFFASGYRRLGSGDHAPGARPAIYMILLAAMALVVVAANTVLLLMAWEIVTIASWYLITSHHEEKSVRGAGLGYLIAGHVSGSALLLLFVCLPQAGTGWAVPISLVIPLPGTPPLSLLFGLALIGFGIKAALAPFHVWLPDAHSAAPSDVSALLSGVLITMGFYGMARFLPVLAPHPAVWGIVLMTLGALGACGGIVMALSQRDVKRILAYSTIENAGLVILSMGAALLATANGRPVVAGLAWSAALLHIWNHAVAKSLLFLAGGAMASIVGSRDLERWGGLLRRLPVLGTALVVGSAALLGLPGTHGFASEFLLFMGLLRGSQELAGQARLAMLLGVVAAAFTAGMALACFVRLLGVGLLGHPRSEQAAEAAEPRMRTVLYPVVTLAGLCFALVPLVQPILALLAAAVRQLAPGSEPGVLRDLGAPLPWLAIIPVLLVATARFGRAWLVHARPIRRTVIWDCAYAKPGPSTQYTATSLSQPILRVLQPALRTSVRWVPSPGLWPEALKWEARTPERALVELYRPALLRLTVILGFLSRLQEGQVMVYLRYLGVALFLLLVWFFLPTGSAP